MNKLVLLISLVSASLLYSAEQEVSSEAANFDEFQEKCTLDNGIIYSVCWTPETSSESQQLIFASEDTRIKIWNPDNPLTVECLSELTGHKGPVNSVSCSSDGKIASGAADNTVKIWNLADQECSDTFSHDKRIFSTHWSPRHSNSLAYGCGNTLIVHKWNHDFIEPLPVTRAKDWAYSVKWSSTEENILACGSSDGAVNILELNSNSLNRKVRLKEHDKTVCALAWLSENQLVSGSADNTIRIWDTRSKYSNNVLKGVHRAAVTALDCLSDRIFVSGSTDNTIRFWDISTLACLQTLQASKINSVACSSDGSLLASGTNNGLTIWERKSLAAQPSPDGDVDNT